MKALSIGIVGALALVAVAGCGSDDGPASVTTIPSATSSAAPPTGALDTASTALPDPTPAAATPNVLLTADPTEPPTATAEPSPIEEEQPERGPVFTIPVLDDSLLHTGEVQGELFDREGTMPGQIIASTDTCQIVSIDSTTGAITVLWEYPDIRIEDHYRDSSLPKEPVPPEDWVPCDYIIELEWINPSHVLVSRCCEPVSGRVDIIDIYADEAPFHFGPSGGLPSVNRELRLVNTNPNGFSSSNVRPAYDIAFVSWDHLIDYRKGDAPLYQIEYFGLRLSTDGETEAHAGVDQISWVGDNKIAVELWTGGPFPGIYPLIALLDIPSQSVTVKSRGSGWMRPSGDTSGNLVVAEQSCYAIPIRCSAPESKVVALDPDTLAPMREVAFNQNIIDMDLARGWLLVTFADGQTGTLNLADGTFTPVATGIVTATWME